MIQIDIKKRIKTYNEFSHIQINTSFQSHAITQIIGPSGAGKTTLLKIIAGLIQPEEGTITAREEIWLDTRACINLSTQKRKVGFVFQDYALFPNMTVRQQLQYGSADPAYIERLLALGRLESFQSHKPKHLSGGQQQRLAILRALSTQPNVLLMDEPFSALDKSLKNNMIIELKELLIETKITCLIVTHYPMETKEFAEYSFELE